jgi:hypothetical protein
VLAVTGDWVSLVEEKVNIPDEFLAMFPPGAHVLFSKLPKVPDSTHKGLLPLMVRYARMHRMFEVRGDIGFPISLIRTVRRRDSSQWVGIVCLVHLLVAVDSSMTHAYALHLLSRCADENRSVRELLQSYRQKTEQGKFHQTARQVICRALVRDLVERFPERYGDGKLVYEGLEMSQEFLDGEISDDEKEEREASNNQDE